MKIEKLLNKIIVLNAIFVLSCAQGQTQQATIASGGDYSSSSGSVSYSIGQIVYTTTTGINGIMAQGIQQPYEIATVLGIEEVKTKLNPLLVYPNPTNDYLTLSVGETVFSEFNFQLYDSVGKLIEFGKVKNTIEIIKMVDLPTGYYFIKVNKNNKPVKIFKIIKN